MEKNDNGRKLDDALLEKISGGRDDYDLCEWSPTAKHQWELREMYPGVKEMRCKWCDIKLY